MKRAAALGAVTLTIWTGCADILDIPSGTGELEALHHTCECDSLQLQRGAFVDACDAAFGDLLDAQATTGKAQLLAVADLGCETCTNVEPCYAAITHAGGEGDACDGSETCAGWACCAGHVELVRESPDNTLKVQGDSDPVCCGECFGCGAVVDAFRQGQSVVVCDDALELANTVAACLSEAAKTPPPPCTDECGFSALVDVAPCVDCLIENGECPNEYQACHSDPDRPIVANGGG